MSLSVYLYSASKSEPAYYTGIFVREDGGIREISEKEWRLRYPDREPVKMNILDCEGQEDNEVYWANITHSLNNMVDAAGIYHHLWRPDEIGITQAKQLIEPLQEGLARLKADPEECKKHNPKNGWGDYSGLVKFVENYLEACRQYPEATIQVFR